MIRHSNATRAGARDTVALLAVIGVVLASCGGGSDDSTAPTSIEATSDDTTDAPDTDDAEPDSSEPGEDDTSTDAGTDDTSTGTSTDTSTDAGTDAGTDDYEPGTIEFRAVNLLDEPVDIYVRTTGLVQAYSIQEGLAPGEVSDVAAPPLDGVFLVTRAGAGDPTCVVGCDHFITEITAFESDGQFHTVLLHDDEFDGPRGYDLWELPTAESMVASNAMTAADPTTGLIVVNAVAATGIDFGVRLSTDVVEGCLESVNLEGILIGGNQTPAFDIGAATSITLHDQPDRECVDEPVGGPFDVAAGPGERLHVFVSGEPGSMNALILPMVVDPAAPPAQAGNESTGDEDSDAGSGDPADDEAASGQTLAIDLMTEEVAGQFGLDEPTARCTAELLVDALGADVLVVGGELVDLDSLPDESIEPAGRALVAAVDECGVDPAIFGG